MIKTLLIFGTAVGLVAAASGASAGACTAEIEALQKQLSSSDAGMGPTGTGQVVESGRLHPPTNAMNEAAEGTATSSEDVLSQNVGEPTDAEAAQTGEFDASAAPLQAEAALERARQFDLAGNEASCMNEVAKAKARLDIQ
ncbi:hypothetical protein [Dongia deserti]|uniref:hypothetical protein n=1 Tax=Dongia deserti TaxID=2268030 RepID=UPI000E64D1D4|nr:hypothetical protein [Dongia deserti]